MPQWWTHDGSHNSSSLLEEKSHLRNSWQVSPPHLLEKQSIHDRILNSSTPHIGLLCICSPFHPQEGTAQPKQSAAMHIFEDSSTKAAQRFGSTAAQSTARLTHISVLRGFRIIRKMFWTHCRKREVPPHTNSVQGGQEISRGAPGTSKLTRMAQRKCSSTALLIFLAWLAREQTKQNEGRAVLTSRALNTLPF